MYIIYTSTDHTFLLIFLIRLLMNHISEAIPQHKCWKSRVVWNMLHYSYCEQNHRRPDDFNTQPAVIVSINITAASCILSLQSEEKKKKNAYFIHLFIYFLEKKTKTSSWTTEATSGLLLWICRRGGTKDRTEECLSLWWWHRERKSGVILRPGRKIREETMSSFTQ